MADDVHGVGVNGETDDFAARYDRMAAGRTGPLAIKALIALLMLLVLVGVVGLAL